MQSTQSCTTSANLYIDTRGLCDKPIPFTEALINGLAHGGGLYVPQTIPTLTLDEILALADMPYAEQAAAIYKRFDIDMSDEMIDALMHDAYGAQFDNEDICPIVSLDRDMHILELWHGPTAAFKDMALQNLPRFFSASAELLRQRGTLDHEFLILVATSGDTGKAALEGFCDLPGVSIIVLYPHEDVSDIQYKQMATQLGSNVCVWAVWGNFDDCQSRVKKVFSDEAFAEELQNNYHIALSSANSINWGRLLPQIVYYISAYARLVRLGTVEAGAPIDVCVPTGNFGNILAAYYAKRMGTPIAMLLCASNENNVLTDFIATGTYDISDRPFRPTPSPSMDILISSNLERLLFELTDRDAEKVRTWMQELKDNKRFRVDEQTFARVRSIFSGDFTTNTECLETIRRVHETYGYLLDPHTAVAFDVAEHLKGQNPVLIASTAHWAKFGENVYKALHHIDTFEPLPDNITALTGCELNRLIEEEANAMPNAIPTSVHRNLVGLDEAPIRFKQIIEPETRTVEQAIRYFLEKK